MVYINLPGCDNELLPFYLAAEEYVARHLKADEYFFMWQVEPTVIFGRNQLIENEVNMDFCRARNIRTFRRKSGGGCVYADKSNIMFSYICGGEAVQFTFDRYLRLIAFLLQKLGLDAHTSTRNDILINGKKVSGNAFYHIPGKNIVHGTMLYDTNMENMVGSITPSDEKLVSKGVKSVRQHITLLKDYIGEHMSIDEFKQYIRENLCEEEQMLDSGAIDRIREIEEEYLTDEFIYGNNPRYSVLLNKHVDGCGHFDVRIEVKNGVIRQVNMMGDYFLVGDLDRGLLNRLRDVPYNEADVAKAIENCNTGDYILNLNNNHFINLLFN
jgi:lipoic acid synthetase/lipoate-protein ligase A